MFPYQCKYSEICLHRYWSHSGWTQCACVYSPSASPLARSNYPWVRTIMLQLVCVILLSLVLLIFTNPSVTLPSPSPLSLHPRIMKAKLWKREQAGRERLSWFLIEHCNCFSCLESIAHGRMVDSTALTCRTQTDTFHIFFLTFDVYHVTRCTCYQPLCLMQSVRICGLHSGQGYLPMRDNAAVSLRERRIQTPPTYPPPELSFVTPQIQMGLMKV